MGLMDWMMGGKPKKKMEPVMGGASPNMGGLRDVDAEQALYNQQEAERRRKANEELKKVLPK